MVHFFLILVHLITVDSENSIPEQSFALNMPHVQLLEEEQLDLLYRNSNIVNYNKKDTIFMQNTRTSHIMLIVSGLVKIFKEGRNERKNGKKP